MFGGKPEIPPADNASCSLLLIGSGDDRFAIYTGPIRRFSQIAIKSAGPQFDSVGWVVGATVLEDARIALVINPVKLALISFRKTI
jgi:chemotaxis protein histidine kinase CheA